MSEPRSTPREHSLEPARFVEPAVVRVEAAMDRAAATLHPDRRPRVLLRAFERLEQLFDRVLAAFPTIVPSVPRTLVERETEVLGTRLVYRMHRGQVSGPAMIHLHGFGISGRYLLPTAGLLAPEFPTYVPDLPGYGRSGNPPDVLGIRGLADAVAAFMDAVGLERATLVGNSLGSAVAASFATYYPERLERVVLVSPAGGPFNQPLLRGLGQLLRDGTREPLHMVFIAVPDYIRFGLLDSVRLFRHLTRYPVLERLVTLGVPSLGVIGTRDPLMPPPGRIHELVDLMDADVQVVALRDVAHAANFSHPALLAHVIGCFLRGEPITAPRDAPGTVAVMAHRTRR